MSSFGAVPLDLGSSSIDYMVSSANKCIEGVPGFSYVIAKTKNLLACKGEKISIIVLYLLSGLQGHWELQVWHPHFPELYDRYKLFLKCC